MRRDAMFGLAFWFPTLALIVFGTTHGLWYDRWQIAEQINFWVATGTGALALVTSASVLATMSVVGSEDRRHREGLAPICVVYVTRTDIFVQNIGLGPAVSVVVEGWLSYDRPVYAPETQASTSTPTPRTVIGRDQGTSNFQTAPISVLAAVRGEPGKWEKERLVEGAWATAPTIASTELDLREKILYCTQDGIRNVRVTYTDMFGNRYETRYDDAEWNRYDWIRPTQYV